MRALVRAPVVYYLRVTTLISERETGFEPATTGLEDRSSERSRGSLYLRKDGRWAVSWIRDGERQVRYFWNQEEAETFLWSLRTSLLTLCQEELDRRPLSPATRATYREALRLWERELGDLSVAEITPARLRQAFLAWSRAGVSLRSQEKAYRVLHTVFQVLVDEGQLAMNPLDRVKKPRYRPQDRVLWSPEEARRFLATCQTSERLHAPLLGFLTLTGLRLGEALALTWRDLVDDRILVDKALVWVGNTPHLGPVKTRAGRRAVPLIPQARAFLPTRRGELTDRIFQGRGGAIPRKATLSRVMDALCTQARVPRIRIHDLRHVAASLLLWSGVDPRTVQAILGHTSATTTLELYAYGGDLSVVRDRLTTLIGEL